ncbi:hypothetical protein [Olivibacter ginsenosidimutans]|uniref:hypothetical protein n=1 Tax=Olivibacter ginsenosidimutans TaxID=1176537 RepID=UPI0031EF20DF
MKMFITLLISLFLAQWFLPWWIIVPISLLVSFFFDKKPLSSFFICFAAVCALWITYSFYQSTANHHLLANRIGVLFGLGKHAYNWLWMVLASGLLGGLIAGFAGLSGQYIRKSLRYKA